MSAAKRHAAKSRCRSLISALGILLALSACKGGGGTGSFVDFSSPFAPPAPVSPGILTAFYKQFFSPAENAAAAALLTSAQYARQNTRWTFTDPNGAPVGPTYNSFPLASSRANYAHAVGLTGAGQLVVVVDTRLQDTHEVFAGKPLLMVGNLPTGPDQSFNDHGTLVSSVLAGSSSSFVGVAPGANIAFGLFETDAFRTIATQFALNNGAVAQNNSWGFDTLPIGASSFQTVFSSASGAAYLAALDAYAATGVVVFAVSNDQTHAHSTLMEALPYVRPGLESGWIAVANAVPTFTGQSVSSVQLLSGSCLEAARWCLLADGAWTGATSVSDTSYGFATGSSFGAPQVSGALALLAEAFPTLTPHELRVRLLASADNHFFAADDTVELATGFKKGYSFTYGLGFLDIRAALLPIGPTSMSLANGSVQLTDSPIVMSGAAMGDAVTRSLAGVDVGVKDALRTDFLMPGASLAATTAPVSLSRTMLARSLTADLTSTRTAPVSAISAPFAAYPGIPLEVTDPTAGLGATVLLPGGSTGDYGISIKRALGDGPTRLELGLKLAHDQGSVMGFGATDGGAGANMLALQLGLSQEIGKSGFLSLSGEIGVADLGAQAALSRVSTAAFNSVALDVGSREVFAAGDRLAFGVSMPVAVTSGSAQIVLPVARSAGSASFEAIDLNLSPSDRQVDMRVSYQRPLAPGLEMLVELVHAENYGNRAGAQDTAGVLTLKYAF